MSFLDIALQISVRNTENQSFLSEHVIAQHPDNSQVMWTLDKKNYEFAEAYPFGNRLEIYERTNYTSWAIYSYTNLNLKGQCKERDLPSEDSEQNLSYLTSLIDNLKFNYKKIKTFNTNEKLNETVTQELQSRCSRSEIEKIKPKSINLMEINSSEKELRLVELLNRGVPVGISFNFKAVSPSADFLHVSTLVGYSEKNRTTVFKLRNSYGKHCRTTTYPVPKCKEGYLYLNSEELMPHLNYMTWIPR